jgi:SAM-dependent methyltransferase
MFLKDWTYTLSDPGLKLFTLANAKLRHWSDEPNILEVGCCDTDFMERAQQAGARVEGIDWRPRQKPHVDAREANVLTVEHHSDFNYDAIVSLSTIEHIGLGRYGDPVDEYGDIKAVQRLRDWLRDDGFFYFDVPYTPEGYGLLDVNKCRCYDDASLLERFGPHEVLGYANPNVDGWVEKPEKNHEGLRPYWYVALLIERKDG